MEESLWTLVSRTVEQSGGIEKAVFFLLLALSLASWVVMLLKFLEFQAARTNNRKFTNLFEASETLGAAAAAAKTMEVGGITPRLSMFEAALEALERGAPQPARGAAQAPYDPRQIPVQGVTRENQWLRLAMDHAAQDQLRRLKSKLSFLATAGSTSPFIGLFGTVWGIMATFRALGGASSTSLAVVAPGISASLIATAAGLAVAIPAVVAYNFFLSQLDRLQEDADQFSERLELLIVSSGYFAHTLQTGAPRMAQATPPAQPPYYAPTAHPAHPQPAHPPQPQYPPHPHSQTPPPPGAYSPGAGA